MEIEAGMVQWVERVIGMVQWLELVVTLDGLMQVMSEMRVMTKTYHSLLQRTGPSARKHAFCANVFS